MSSEYFEDHPVSIAIAYDGFGRKQSVTHETGLTGTYAYDILNRVTSIAWSGNDGSGTQAISQGLAYNSAGNITSQQREHGLFTYSYDNIDQLTAVAFSGAAALDAAIVNRTWTYDRVGNRIGDTLNGAGSFQHNILTENDKYEYVPSVDGSGALGERINKLTGEVETFSYRADGRLKTYENNTQKVEYVLDPLGRRIAKKVTNKSDNTTFNQSFLHLGAEDRVLFAKSGDGKQYLYLDGQGIDEHLAEVSATHVKSYATDHLGSVLNTSTAGSNNVYGPWGETLGVNAQQTLTPTTVPVEYFFAGRELDRENGSSYNRKRNYFPEIGQFTAPDPLGFAGGHSNWWNYAGNNPLLFIDPLGLSRLFFSRSENQLYVYPGNGDYVQGPPQVFEAANNVVNPNADPNQKDGFGPAPSGEFSMSRYADKSFDRVRFGSGIFYVDIPSRPGIGIHAGRRGPFSRTQGCIRTTEPALNALRVDSPTKIFIGE